MKLSILLALTLWVTVAAACAAATPIPLPTATPATEPTPANTPEPPLAYPDIGYPIAETEKWLKVLQDYGLEEFPGVVTMYIKSPDNKHANLHVIVSGKEHLQPVREQTELAGLPSRRARVLVDNPWHRQHYTCTKTPNNAIC